MRFFKDANFAFLAQRRKAYILSSAAVGIGIVGMILGIVMSGSWLNYGVDFTGGTLVQVRFDGNVTAGDLRSALGGAQAPAITRFGADNEFTIRAPLPEDTSDLEVVAQGIRAQIDASPLGSYEVVRTEVVGPKIGAELTRQAALAILFSFFLTLLYIAFRFEFRFGLAAILATVHDILITLGFLALFRIEISLPTVAAILTIVGYSLNDTIVVFDRIRENLNKKGGRREDPIALTDRSINEVLPRTVMTSGTTLAVLLSLLLLGGAVLRDFTLVLILGVVIGTYSSIFVASPALIEIQRRWVKKESKKTAVDSVGGAAKRGVAGV
jgi:preprotein translocase subunit SecF